MPRRVRKVILYVCTLDGSVHRTRAEARAHGDRIGAKATAPRRGGRRRSSHVDRILRAIDAGARDALAVRSAAKVPPRLVHPTISNLRKRGLVKGMTGELELTPAGREKISPGPTRRA